jgi:hypothetical protein
VHVGYRSLVARLLTPVCEIFGEGEIERLNGAHEMWQVLQRGVVAPSGATWLLPSSRHRSLKRAGSASASKVAPLPRPKRTMTLYPPSSRYVPTTLRAFRSQSDRWIFAGSRPSSVEAKGRSRTAPRGVCRPG